MDITSFIGVPWKDRGRDSDGCDCWGLVRMIYKEALNIDLPSYHELYATAADAMAVRSLIMGNIGPWREIEKGKERWFDCALMREAGVPRHIGIVCSRGSVLHLPPGKSSVIETYDEGKNRHRIVGFWRYKHSP